jgi:hypothetical protein
MSDDIIKGLLPALGIAAFERRSDGSFESIAPRPEWFGRLIADPTFPFLGHVLDEAKSFWKSGLAGRRQWGPVAEVGESGDEFHYYVAAVTTDDAQFLIFVLDSASDDLRGVMQQVRADKLAAEQRAGVMARERNAQLKTLRRAADQFRAALSRLSKSSNPDTQLVLLTESGSDLLMAIDDIVQATRPKAKAP